MTPHNELVPRVSTALSKQDGFSGRWKRPAGDVRTPRLKDDDGRPEAIEWNAETEILSREKPLTGWRVR